MRAIVAALFLSILSPGLAHGAEGALEDASRAVLAACTHDLRGTACGAALDRAETQAAEARIDEPEAVGPRLTLALALGMKGKRATISEALSARYASRGKALIEEALQRAPENPRCHALLGAWNLEILRRGGPVGARLMGASGKAGVLAFERARALDPSSAVIALHYAVALLAIDPRRYGEKARGLLAAASLTTTPDALEVDARDEARRLGAVMASQGVEAAAESAARSFL